MGWAGIGDALEETRQRGKVALGNATENGKEKLVAAKEVGVDQVQAVKGTAERLAAEVTQDVRAPQRLDVSLSGDVERQLTCFLLFRRARRRSKPSAELGVDPVLCDRTPDPSSASTRNDSTL